MRVVNDPLTLICVTQSERAKISHRNIHKLPSGIFVARGIARNAGGRWLSQISVEITGKVNLLEESIENEIDEKEDEKDPC